MSVHGDVHAALKAQLATWANAPLIATENRIFTPVTNEPYLRERLAPQDSTLSSLGPHGRIRHSGGWFVDVFAPPLIGVTVADDLADQLLILYPPALTLTYNGRVVIIEKTYRSGGIQGADWYQIPVMITWYTDTVNTI